MQILVIAPMEQEAKAFKKALSQYSERNHKYRVITCGVGKVNAAQNVALEVFSGQNNYDLAVVIGYAGASPYFHQGDFILPSTAKFYDVHVPEPFKYLDPTYELSGSDDCIILTGDSFVNESLSKELSSQYGDKWVCDMESSAVAQVLDDTQIPLFVIKLVSDIPANNDPEAFGKFVESHQDFTPFLAFLEQLS